MKQQGFLPIGKGAPRSRSKFYRELPSQNLGKTGVIQTPSSSLRSSGSIVNGIRSKTGRDSSGIDPLYDVLMKGGLQPRCVHWSSRLIRISDSMHRICLLAGSAAYAAAGGSSRTEKLLFAQQRLEYPHNGFTFL